MLTFSRVKVGTYLIPNHSSIAWGVNNLFIETGIPYLCLNVKNIIYVGETRYLVVSLLDKRGRVGEGCMYEDIWSILE